MCYYKFKEIVINKQIQKKTEVTNSSIICANKLHKQREYFLILPEQVFLVF